METALSCLFLVLLGVLAVALLRWNVGRTLQALRTPLLLWSISVAIPLAALAGNSLARGLFWVSRGGALLVCTLAFFICWEFLFLHRLIRCCGGVRLRFIQWPVKGRPSALEYAFSSLPGILAVAAVIVVSGLKASSDDRIWLAAGIVGGFVLACALVLIAVFFQHWSADPGTEILELTPMFGFLQSVLTRPAPRILTGLAELVSRTALSAIHLADPTLTGYRNAKNELHDGHVAATVLLFVALGISAVYFTGYRLEIWWFAPGLVPPIVYIYLTLIIAGWIISALSFLLDGFGVPTLTAIAFWSWLITFNPYNQHYFAISKIDSSLPAVARPADVLLARRNAGHNRIIMVSADGGGIQASAWSTEVLTQLACELGPNFGNSIALMSGVSGGSTGVMFFQTLYDQNGFHGSPDQLEKVWRAGSTAALSDAAFGLTYYDLTRPFVPFLAFGEKDRGTLLEKPWERTLSGELNVPAATTLGSLRPGVAEGKRPVLLFNATVADTGQAFVFGNASLGKMLDVSTDRFEDQFKDKDIRLVTAVRLSATFPFVSPPARAAENLQPFAGSVALVDGGYYDNYGVVNALAWLRAALAESPANSPVPEVMWLQIRSSKSKDGKAHPLATSLVGPLWTLYQMRGAAQRSRAEQLNEMVQRAAGELNVNVVVPPPLEFPGEDAPLSWLLTNEEKKAISEGWSEVRNSGTIEQIRQFVNGQNSRCAFKEAAGR